MTTTQPQDDRTAKCFGCGSTGPITPCSWCQDAQALSINIHNAPADMDYYAGLTDDELRELAIEFRNEILDELRRREETIEALAEDRWYPRGLEPETARGYHIPTWPYAR